MLCIKRARNLVFYRSILFYSNLNFQSNSLKNFPRKRQVGTCNDQFEPVDFAQLIHWHVLFNALADHCFKFRSFFTLYWNGKKCSLNNKWNYKWGMFDWSRIEPSKICDNIWKKTLKIRFIILPMVAHGYIHKEVFAKVRILEQKHFTIKRNRIKQIKCQLIFISFFVELFSMC